MDGNQLTGEIPPELSNLSNLTYLDLGSTQLTGSIPAELGDLSNLQSLSLDVNELTGEIPAELLTLSSLRGLSLGSNQLTGEIPAALADLSNLRFLGLSANQLTGKIPAELGNLSNLWTLDLSDNDLTGSIPAALGNLSSLYYLYLNGNQLTGELPAELGNLTNLIWSLGINLKDNHLYTDSNALRDFINAKSAELWEDFQTLFSYFAQFGEGLGLLSSQIVLFNLNDQSEATGQIEILDDWGDQMSVDLNDEIVNGVYNFSVPAGGLLNLRTDGVGELQAGSVRITSDRHVEGVVIFGGEVGLAGVGSSAEFPTGFAAPMLRNYSEKLNTGIAIMNLSAEDSSMDLTLLDSDGVTLATASGVLVAQGHDALYVDEFDWGSQVDFSEFSGTLVVTSEQPVTGTVIQTLPGEFITMPVAPLQTPQPAAQYKLYFAQFADGLGLITSQILLLNLGTDETATAQIEFRNDAGEALTVDLNGEQIIGETQVQIAASGLQVLTTDGLGDLIAGSVSVTSDQPLAGVIIFTAEGIGAAGVGSSADLVAGFLAPMETKASTAIRTGVAMMNLETDQLSLTADLLLSDGSLLDSVEMSLAPLGHQSIYLDEFD